MIHITGIPGRITSVNGEEFLFFSGFAYLGMTSLSEFNNMVKEGLRKYGAVFPSSRISNTRSLLFEEFESGLSSFIGLPASASFSSGYMASQAAVSYASKFSELLYSPGIHPSLLVAQNVVSHINDHHWTDEITDKINQNGEKKYTIVMESLNPLTGEIHDFSWLSDIRNPFRLLIDDSHGIGVIGNDGRGIISTLSLPSHARPLVCYSLAKAFSCEGGGVSGDDEDIRLIKKSPWFTAATGMSPAYIYAWKNCNNLFKEQLAKLKKNISYFDKKISAIPFIHHDKELPSYRVREGGLYDFSLGYHILLSAFRYPSEKDPLMARIVLNSLHTEDDLMRLITCIEEYQKTVGNRVSG